MATTVTAILNEARKYIGVTGGSTKHRYIVDTYNTMKNLPRYYPVQYYDDWCDIFVTFLAVRTNALDIIDAECSVERHIDRFKKKGIWIEDGTITPKVGDIITFNWNSNVQPNNGVADHIGIVEKVHNGVIGTIEGNANDTVLRREYRIGHGNIRGFARPKYNQESTSLKEYNMGDIVNVGYRFAQKNIRLLIKYAKKYQLRPSFLIAQMFVESKWGDAGTSIVGSVDNNWSGISEPFKAPSHLGVKLSRGSSRLEGGYYVHFKNLEDYFKVYTYILSKENGLYKVTNVSTVEQYCRGLFKVTGANANYAETNNVVYSNDIISSYYAIKRQNPGKLEAIDGSDVGNDEAGNDSSNNGNSDNSFVRVPETGVFHPNQTINIRSYPSRSGAVVAQYRNGESFVYDSYVVNDGHVWLSYISYSGARRYVAWRVNGGETFGIIDDENGGVESFERVPESGVFYPNQTVNIRDYPNRNGKIIAQYHSGENFTYDSYVINDSHIWLSYVSYSGARRYVAWRVRGGDKFGTINDKNQSEAGSNIDYNHHVETGTFYPNQTINVRTYPSIKGGSITQYHKGESVTYDSYVINDGYVWLSYISYSGQRRYLAWRVRNGETYGTIK